THRAADGTDIYFVANVARYAGTATCSFKVTGMQPELWNPVTGTTRSLQQFDDNGKRTSFVMDFDKAQSFFVVFRHKQVKQALAKKDNFPVQKQLTEIKGTWNVRFDPRRG